MSTSLELITAGNLVRSAGALSEIVQADPNLEVIRPDSHDRLHTPELATTNLLNIIGSRTMDAFLLGQDREAAGLATRIRGSAIKNPVQGGRPWVLKGDQWDYWTRPDIDYEEHERLVLAFGKVETTVSLLIAMITAKEARRAPGFSLVMNPVGEPGQVQLPLLRRLMRRDYGLSAVTEPIQVYTMPRDQQAA